MRNGDRAVRKIADSLLEQGYDVEICPDPSILPFNLGSYRPDIVATKPNDFIIVEVKTKSGARNMEYYKNIAQVVRKTKNWRFLLATVDDDDNETGRAVVSAQVDPEHVASYLEKITVVLGAGLPDMAIPFMWNAYIVAMRTIGERKGVPVDVTSDKSLIRYMYSLGEISHDEYEKSLRFLELRNMLSHSFDVKPAEHEVDQFVEFIVGKLLDWGFVSGDLAYNVKRAARH